MASEAEAFYEEDEGDQAGFHEPIFAPRKEYLPSRGYKSGEK